MIIENNLGRIVFSYKNDLNEEEGDLYLPSFYHGRVVELCMIESFQKGNGKFLMQEFLAHEAVKNAGLIFLDCSPLFSEEEESVAMTKLYRFFSHFGFISKRDNGYSRMWHIQELPERTFPLFSLGIDLGNDLHSVLEPAWRANKQ